MYYESEPGRRSAPAEREHEFWGCPTRSREFEQKECAAALDAQTQLSCLPKCSGEQRHYDIDPNQIGGSNRRASAGISVQNALHWQAIIANAVFGVLLYLHGV